MSAVNGRVVEYVFEQPNPVPDYWAFSDTELARSCLMIAESGTGTRDAFLRAEALRVFLLWREAINAQHGTAEPRDWIALLWSLRKRTIQMLVRLSLRGLLFIP